MTPFAGSAGSARSVRSADTLTRDALAVLQPGFAGTTAPDWLLRGSARG